MRPAVSLHIDTLVLEGVRLSARQSMQLQNALTAELTRLLVAEPLRASNGQALPSAPAGTVVQASAGPAELGRQIAQSIHQSLLQNL